MESIEKSVPLPTDATTNRGGRPFQHLFHQMEVGDSIAYGSPEEGRRALKAARNYGYRAGKRFIGRTEVRGFRIWRRA